MSLENVEINEAELIDEDPVEISRENTDWTQHYDIEETDEGKSVRYFKPGTFELHRLHGPAVKTEYSEEWYKDGLLHREDGPAQIVVYDGKTEYTYALNGSIMSQEEFETKVKPPLEVEFLAAVAKAKEQMEPIHKELLEKSKALRELEGSIDNLRRQAEDISRETGIPVSGEFGFIKGCFQPGSRMKYESLDMSIIEARLEEAGIKNDWHGYAMLEVMNFDAKWSNRWKESTACK